MAYVTSKADNVPSGRGISFSRTIALVIAAFAFASGVAAWIDDLGPIGRVLDLAALTDINTSSFDERFSVASASGSSSTSISPRSLIRALPSELEMKFHQAKGSLARKLQSQGWRTALLEEPTSAESTSQESTSQESTSQEPANEQPVSEKPTIEEPARSSVAIVPLPKSRPVEANLEAQASLPAAQSDNRTLLEKLSDLLPGRVTLASLAPDGGLFHEGPNLASLGYDSATAVYDISARAVYMPDGSKLEAHSGLGSLMDDPAHVSEHNVGATPPNVYDLRPRERLFHGVQALRMIPVGDSGTLGRSGLLAHSYMLGPNGDSNGCVSIKYYDKFLNAFTKGEIKRLVVVPSLGDGASASRRSTSQS